MMKWVLLLGVTWASSCVIPPGDSNPSHFIDIVSSEGGELPNVLQLVSGRPALLRLRPPSQTPPIDDISLTLTVPPGLIVSVPPSNASTTTLLLNALVSTGLVFAVSSTGELPPSSICFSRAQSLDRDFQGVLPAPLGGGSPGKLDFSSTIAGVIRVGVRGPTGLVPAKSFAVFSTELPAPEWQGPWPFRVELRIDMIRNARTSRAGGKLPIIVPQGWFLEDIPDKFLVIPQMPDSPPGLLIPNYLTFIPVQVTSASPREIRFGAVVSDDPQWAGVLPDVTSVTVTAYQRAKIEVTPSYFLGVLPNSAGSISFKPSVSPLFPVEIGLVVPSGFTTDVSKVTLPANSSAAVVVSLTASDSLSRAASFLQFLAAKSDDIQFTYLTPNNGGLLVYSTNKGQVRVLGLNTSVELYVNSVFNFTIEFIRAGPFSMEGGEIAFSVPPGFSAQPPSLKFPKFSDSSEAISRQQYNITVVAGGAPMTNSLPFVIRDVVSRDVQWSGVSPDVSSFLISSWKRGVVTVSPSSISCLQRQSTNFSITLQPPPTSEVFFELRFVTAAFRVRDGTRVRVSAGQTNKLVVVDAVAEFPVTNRDNITLSPAVSTDRQFNNVTANVSVVEIYSTVQGSVGIQKGGSSELLPLTLLRLQANTVVTLVVSLSKPGRFSVDGALIPITYSSADLSLQGKWLTKEGLRFPLDAMEPADYGRAVSLEMRAGDHKSTSVVTFGPLVSSDIQWSGVVPSVTNFTVITVLEALVTLSRSELRLLVGQNATFNITVAFPPSSDVVFPLGVPENFIAPSSATVRAGESSVSVTVAASDLPSPLTDLRVFPGSSNDLSYDKLPPAADTVRVSSVVRGDVQREGFYPRQIFTFQQVSLLIRLINRTPFFIENGGGVIPFSVPKGFNFTSVGATAVPGGLQFSPLTGASLDINITISNDGTRAAGLVEMGAIQSQDPQWGGLLGVSFALSSTTRGNITVLPSSCSVGHFVGEVGVIQFLLSDSSEQEITLQITGSASLGTSPFLKTQSAPGGGVLSVITFPSRVTSVNITVPAANDATFPEVFSVFPAQTTDLQFGGVVPSCKELELYSTYRGEYRILNAPEEIILPPFGSFSLVLELVKKGKYSPQSSTSFIPVRVPAGYSLRVGGRLLSRDVADPTLYKLPILNDLEQSLTLQADGLSRPSQKLEFLPIESEDIQWKGLVSFPSSIRLSSGNSLEIITYPPSLPPSMTPSSLAPSILSINSSFAPTSIPSFTPTSIPSFAPTTTTNSTLAPTTTTNSTLTPTTTNSTLAPTTTTISNFSNFSVAPTTFNSSLSPTLSPSPSINNSLAPSSLNISFAPSPSLLPENISAAPTRANTTTTSPTHSPTSNPTKTTISPTNTTNTTNINNQSITFSPTTFPFLNKSEGNKSFVLTSSPTSNNSSFTTPNVSSLVPTPSLNNTLGPVSHSPSTSIKKTESPTTLSPATLSPSTSFPTRIPTSLPTSQPSLRPTLAPTSLAPTQSRSQTPTQSPTQYPITRSPSESPSLSLPASFPPTDRPNATFATQAPSQAAGSTERSTPAPDYTYLYIIAGVVGGVLLLLICCCLWRRNKSDKDAPAGAAGGVEAPPEQQGLVDHGQAAVQQQGDHKTPEVEMAEQKSLLPLPVVESQQQELANRVKKKREKKDAMPVVTTPPTFDSSGAFPANAPEPVVDPVPSSSSSTSVPISSPVLMDSSALPATQLEPHNEGGYYDGQDQEGYAYADEGGEYYEEPYYYGEEGQGMYADGQYYEAEPDLGDHHSHR